MKHILLKRSLQIATAQRTTIRMVSSAFADRPHKQLVLFDVDNTLSLPRQVRPKFSTFKYFTHVYTFVVNNLGHEPRFARSTKESSHRLCWWF